MRRAGLPIDRRLARARRVATLAPPAPPALVVQLVRRVLRVLRVLLVPLVLVLGPVGCAHRTGPITDSRSAEHATRAEAEAALRSRSIEEAGLALRPVDAWPGRRQLRQRVRIDWTGGSETFDAVLQRRPGELVLFGLGPMNLVGFRLALVAGDPARGTEQRIDIENRTGRALPFSPGHVLADVQRVFYPWIASAGEHGVDCETCERTGRSGDLEIRERGPAGRPTDRRFVVVDAPEAGEIHVRYADWRGDPAFPAEVELENGWFGYRLRIQTLESTPLPTP